MRLRSRFARLKKKTPLGGAASGRTGGHGDDVVLLTSWAHWQGKRPRGKWSLPRTRGLSDQRRLQPKRASRGGSSGRFVAHRTSASGVDSAGPGKGRESGTANRG